MLDPGRELASFAEGVQRLPGLPSGPVVSPDGRYPGWIDFRGPRRIGYCSIR